MRLIDADELTEELGKCFYDTTNPAARRAAHDTMALCQSLVDEQPTAYDVEKVVEKIADYYDLVPGWALKEIIEIIKSSGIR